MMVAGSTGYGYHQTLAALVAPILASRSHLASAATRATSSVSKNPIDWYYILAYSTFFSLNILLQLSSLSRFTVRFFSYAFAGYLSIPLPFH